MFRHNLLLATRLIRKDSFFSLIIVAGLAISYCVFHILWNYADQELQADQHHPHADRIYRVYYNWRYTDDGVNYKNENWGAPFFVCAPWLKNHFPEIEEYTRVVNQVRFGEALVGHSSSVYFVFEPDGSQPISFKEESVVYADENLFRFFNIPLSKGDNRSVLKETNSVAIAQSVAKKYFKDNEPIGKILLLNGTDAVKVTGVFEDLPSYTHLKFDIVLSDVRFADKFTSHNFSGCSNAYIRLQDKVNYEAFKEKVKDSNKEYWAPLKYDVETGTNQLLPLRDVSFTNGLVEDNFQVKSRAILNILKLVAVFILVMGWINYINLTFSRVIKRIKELATRKSFGAGYSDFLQQFFIETIILNVAALIIAVGLAWVSADAIHSYTKVPMPDLAHPLRTALLYIGIILPGCLLAALYPTFIANRFGIQTLYRGSFQSPGKGRGLIHVITVFQYGVSAIMIMWIFVMNLQMNLILTADTGMNKEQVVIVDGPLHRDNNYASQVTGLGNEIRKIEGVVDFTVSNSIPGDNFHHMVLFKRPGKDFNAGLSTNGGVDENFMSFYGIDLVAGKAFTKDMPSAAQSIMLSVHGLERLGFSSPEEAVGQRVIVADWDAGTIDVDTREVTGIFREYRLSPFLSSGLKAEDETGSQGLFLSYKNSDFSFLSANRLSIRINGSDMAAIMRQVEIKFNSLFPNAFFHWYFLEDHYNRAYENHQNFRHQIFLFTLLAIFIACIGLLGSTSFLAIARVREIGIRKVLGAGWHQLAFVLVKTTTKQILLSTIIAVPLGYYFVAEYLQQYTLRLPLQWWYFFIPLILLTIVLLITVLPLLLRAIHVNPVKALKE